MRQRFKVQNTPVGSSEKERNYVLRKTFTTVGETASFSAVAISSPERKEPENDSTLVKVFVISRYIKCPWGIVKGAKFNNWTYV